MSYINTKSKPSWSPDSKRVAVELGSRSYVVNKEDKTVQQQLGNPDRWVSSPSFDPDSNAIVYSSYDKIGKGDETGWGIYRKDLDTGETKRLTTRGHSPTYNPNGDELVFQGLYGKNYDNRLTMIREDGTGRAPVVEKGTLQNEFNYDSTGNRLAYQTYGEVKPELRILERDWGRDNAVTDGNEGGYWDRSPQWSPDDKTILFERHGRNLDGKRIVQLWTVDVASGEENMLPIPDAKALDPTWSPDGKKIAFISDMDGEGWFDLYTMDADGKNLKHEVDELGDQHAPVWSPDGETIAFYTYDWMKPKEYQHTLNFLPTPSKPEQPPEQPPAEG